jgi:endo-1,4-beta-xylanase
MLSLKYLVTLLPVLLGLATPALSSPLSTHDKHAEILGNVTLNEGIERRSTVFSTSKDGVNSAGFYYSLYNDNKASAGYTEFPNSGQFQVGWSMPSEKEFLGGKGYRGGSTR